MPIKKHINLNVGSFLNLAEKKIVVNLASEDILTLITQELKTHYSPETQKQALEGSSQLLPDFVLQELLKRQEQVVNVNPNTLIVVNCQIAEVEVDDLGFDLNVEAYFVIGDANGQNYFRANRIGLWSNIWGDEEKLFDLEDELGDQFWTNYQIQLLFDKKKGRGQRAEGRRKKKVQTLPLVGKKLKTFFARCVAREHIHPLHTSSLYGRGFPSA